jgi:galactokinase
VSDTTQTILTGFRDRFEHDADGLWFGPGRVNLIGEHTDYNDGFVFPFAIDRRAVVALAVREDRTLRVASSFTDEIVTISLDDLAPETVSGWSAYPLGVAWALGEHGADLSTLCGFDAYIDSDVPIGAGLSSSAAIECATAVALNEVWDLGFEKQVLVRVGQLAENRVVGAPTGILDQSASLLGRTDAAVFLDCRSFESEVIPLGFDAAGLELLVIDTKVSHAHATGGYADRRASCEQGAARMGVGSLRDLTVADLPRAAELLDEETFRRVRHILTENQRVLDTVQMLREEGPGSIGELLDASHASMRDDFEISVAELDLAVDTARANGALGARMTGGGFGGSAIALTPHAAIPAVQQAVADAFAAAGYRAPDMFVVRAAAGAGRLS